MENHRTLSYLPQDPPLRSAARARLIVSWWDREIHIWRLRKPLEDLVNSSDGESAVAKNRKLLARVLIKGEANITSATIDDDGSLLVVTTTSDTKAFHLKPRSDARKDELKISKVEVPEGVAAHGATRTQISPDGQWLCLVQEGNSVYMFRLTRDSEAEGKEKPVIHPKAIRLQRLGRKIAKHIALGGLGQYDRTISHVAFSPDSKMLAVADVAGYIDTWVLREQTLKLQNGVNGTHDAADSDASMSDGEDGDHDQGAAATAGGTFRWVRNPSAALIPKLHAAPTVLSFSNHIPNTTTPSPTTGNADQEESSPPDDYVLLAVTARPQILVLNPSLGSLTAWSRRNPVSRFPVEFRNIRDLVKGALWSGDRIWLYGNNFLAMLDLTQDVAEADNPEGATNASSAVVPASGQQQQGRKRKRGPDTGAGNKMESGIALGPTKILRHESRKKPAQELSLDRAIGGGPVSDTDATSGHGDDDDDDSDSADDDSEDEQQRTGELALLRAQDKRGQVDAGGESYAGTAPKPGAAFWCTYKYRPILGLVPLGGGGEDANGVNGQQLKKTLEVALVERPTWEIDMPERYFADGEYDR